MPRYYVREFYMENIQEKRTSRLSPCIKAKRLREKTGKRYAVVILIYNRD